MMLCAVAIVALVVGRARPAGAHAFLVTSSPQTGERLAAPPQQVVLKFSEGIVSGSGSLSIRRAGGPDIGAVAVRETQDGTVLRAKLPHLRKGIYIVTWRAAAEDSHVSSGELAFAVGNGGHLSSIATSSQGTSWPDAAAGWLLLTGAVVALGGLVSERFIWRPVEPHGSLSVPRAPVTAAVLVSLGGALLQSLLLVRGQSSPTGGFGGALASRPGALGAAEVILLVAALPLVASHRARPWGAPLLAGVVVAAALRGHPGTNGAWWAGPVGAAHGILAAVWLGALFHLLVILWRRRAEGLRSPLQLGAGRYARLALLTVPVLLLTGVATALAELDSPSALLTTDYGRILIVKSIIVAGAIALALVARTRALRRRRAGLLRRLTSIEGLALLLVVMVTAALANTAPPLSTVARHHAPRTTATSEASGDERGPGRGLCRLLHGGERPTSHSGRSTE